MIIKRYSKRFKKNVVVIYPGEHYVSTKDIISTILGSCISVCIKDTRTGLAGMNHFLLPGDVRSRDMFVSSSGKYGMFAMEILIGDLIKRGADRKGMVAKVFGGGHVLNFRKTDGNVPENNIEFVLAYLSMEKIPIIAKDVGGDKGRKILFFTDTGKVLLKRLIPQAEPGIMKLEEEYKAKVFKESLESKDVKNGLTLF